MWQSRSREGRKDLNRDDGIPLPSLASLGKSPARCKVTKRYMPVRNKKKSLNHKSFGKGIYWGDYIHFSWIY